MSIARSIPVALTALLFIACSKPETSSAPRRPAAATPAPEPAPSIDETVRDFRIGKYAAMALYDGVLKFANDGKTFGVGRAPEEIAQLLSAAGVSTTELSLNVQSMLVNANDRVLLFDTGAGSSMGEGVGKLKQSMDQAGVEPIRVTDVFISHAHGDHVGGLIDSSGAAVFPNATIHLSKPEWDMLNKLGEEEAAKRGITNYSALIAAITPRVSPFTPGREIIPDVVKAVEIKGHTPGHSGYLVTSDSASVLYIGDAVHHYVLSVQAPDWPNGFDRDQKAAQENRKQLIAQSADAGQRIFAVHFPFPGIGKFEKQGESYVWKAEEL